MIKRSERDIRLLLRDTDELAAIISNAQRDAVRRHRLLGQAVAIWRDGRVVIEIPAELFASTEGEGSADP
jgi:hypothetical protein